MGTLTVKGIEAAKLPAGKKEHSLHDGDNLVLRLRGTAAGVSKSWQFQFRYAGKRDKIYIGAYPAISLSDARIKSQSYNKLLADGANPKTHVARQKAEVLADHLAVARGELPKTLSQLFERWKADYLHLKHNDSGKYLAGIFERHILPSAGELHLDTLRPRHIKALLDAARRDKGLTRTCGVMLAALRQLFDWGYTYEWVNANPTVGLKADDWDGDGDEGDRVLSEQDVVDLMTKLPESSMSERWQRATLLILATTTRSEETLLAERSHIDLDKGTWVIPAANQKTTRRRKPSDHLIYLSPFARSQIEALLALPGTTRFLFPARVREGELERPANKKTLYHALTDRQIGGEQHTGRASDTSSLRLDSGQFTVHDLRRTSATLMGNLGVNEIIVERCLNHSLPDKVQRIYNRSEMRELVAKAWMQLGAKLEECSKKADATRKDNARKKAISLAIAATEGMI